MAETNAVMGEGAAPAAAPAPASPATEPAAGSPMGSLPADGAISQSSGPVDDSRALGTKEGSDDAGFTPGILNAEEQSDVTADGVLGAPEEGYKFEPVEGSPVQISDDMLDAFGKVAKELNLSQESAQKVVSAMAPAMMQRYQGLRTEWGAATQADPEFGGANFRANLKGIQKAYRDTTTPELRAILQQSGLDSHPEVVRHFYRLSKERAEGRFITSGNASGGGSGPTDDFYKGMKP